MKMDLRWQIHHVTGTISRAFDLRPQSGETQLWLFHGPPSASCEEPLNAHTIRTEQTTLKDLQRSAMYISTPTKKPLSLHAVELPFQPGRQVAARDMCPVCVRFYDEAVREVGSCIIVVPNTGTVQDILVEAKKQLQPDWGIQGSSLRCLEVTDGRLHKLYRPDATVRSLACFGKSNIFFHCLRVESDADSLNLAESQRLVEIFHTDRQSQQAFAQPFLMPVAVGEKAGVVKNRCKAKLRVADAEFKSWRLVRVGRGGKTHLKDDEPWDADAASDGKLCLEHVHPNPTNSLSRQSRYNKPLTIK